MVEKIKREYNDSEEPVTPLTPESTPGKNNYKRPGDEASSEGCSSSASPPSKKCAKKNKVSSSRSKKQSKIPSSYEEASESDKLLLRMKGENKSSTEICAAVEKFTGEKLNKGSLMARYTRLKASITVMSKQDQAQLLSCKEIVEAKLEREKWNMVAEEMRKNGSGSFTGAAVEKQFKKMMKSDYPAVKIAKLDEGSD